MMGSWRKKLDFSTDLTVVDQVMLYPTRWETRAADMGIDMPVKKMAKKAVVGGQSIAEGSPLTNPLELIERHLPGTGQLETVSERDGGDVTDADEEDDTDQSDVPRGEVVSVERHCCQREIAQPSSSTHTPDT